MEELSREARWDPEAFTPVLRQLNEAYADAPQLSRLATVTHPAEITRLYEEGEHSKPFLLAKNIRPLLADTDDALRVSLSVLKGIPQNRLQTNDVLVTRSGANSGMACVYLGASGDIYTSGEGLIVRSLGDMDGAYLSVYLNTQPGAMLCRRAIYGSGQPHVSPRYLELTRVPRLGYVEAQAASLVREAYAVMEEAGRASPQAEAELLERLGWNQLNAAPKELYYTASMDTLGKANRCDPEYFQPQYARLAERIKQRGGMTLGELCNGNVGVRGVAPAYDPDGEVLLVNSQNLGPTQMDVTTAARVSSSFAAQPAMQEALIARHDVLTYATGAYTGRTNCYLSDTPALAGIDVIIHRPDPSKCNPIYLALFLNSPPGIQLSRREGSGSAQVHIYPRNMASLPVFVPRNANGSVDLDWQNTLAAKVQQAGDAKTQARHKLEQAKRLVEDALAANTEQKNKLSKP